MRSIVVGLLSFLLIGTGYAGRNFNGTSDVATVPGVSNSIDITGTEMTASCWVKLTSMPAGEIDCLSKGDAYYLSINEAGHASNAGFGLFISIPLNHVQNAWCSTTINLNTWYLLTFRYKASDTAKMYINGSLCATDLGVGLNGTVVSSGGSLSIGKTRVNGGSAFFPGIIAEAAIWNVALSDNEIASLAKVCPINVRPQSIAGYWPLYGASGATIEPEMTGKGLSATLTGTSAAAHPPCTPSTRLQSH